MEVLSLTTPVGPSGLTSTQTPFGISGALSATTQPLTNRFPNKITKLERSNGVYYGNFTIDFTQTTGAKVFDHRIKFPLGSGLNEYTGYQVGDTDVFNIAWDLVFAFFSKQCKIEWDLEMTPVKVADSRVSLDVVFDYSDNIDTYSQNTLNNDTLHKIIDEQDDPFRFTIPLFWLTKYVQTDSHQSSVLGSPVVRQQPAFIPLTRTAIFIRNKFQPNQMQPIIFDNIVVLYPKTTLALGFAGKRLVRNNFPVLNDFVPVPYFMNHE